MNEENVNGVQTPVNNNQVGTPVVPVPDAAQQATPATQSVAPAPEVAQPVQQPASPAPAPTPVPTPAPVPESVPVQQPVAPAPVQATPISNEGGFGKTVVSSAPAPEMPSVAPAPQPLNTNFNQNISTAPSNSNSTITPSVPLGDQVGFVSTGQPVQKKKAKKGLIAVIVLIVLVGLGLLTWFVIVPMVKRSLTTPKQVFDTTITTLNKEINNNIELITHDKATYTLDLEIDSNIETIKDFAGYTYTGKLGLDTNNKLAEIGLSIADKYENKYSMFNYVKGGKTYQRYSTNENLLYVGEDTMDWESLTKDTLTPDEAKYLVDKFSTMFKDSLDEKYLTKNDDSSITVNGETVKASKFTYKIVDENLIATIRHFAKGILDDEKLFDILIKMQTEDLTSPTDVDIEELRENFENDLETIIEEEPTTKPLENSSIEISIYSQSKNGEFAGIELISEGDEDSFKIQYSTLNGSYNIFIYNKSVWDNETTENTIRIDGVKSGNVTKTTVKVEDTTYATFKLTDDGNGGKSIDYEILLENIEDFKDYGNITGNLTYTTKTDEEKQIDTLDFEIKSGKSYFKTNVKLTTDWTSEVANINTSASITPTDAELETIVNNFFTEFENKTPFGTLNGLLESDDYYTNEEKSPINQTFGA